MPLIDSLSKAKAGAPPPSSSTPMEIDNEEKEDEEKEDEEKEGEPDEPMRKRLRYSKKGPPKE